jgi:hypothetical protein
MWTLQATRSRGRTRKDKPQSSVTGDAPGPCGPQNGIDTRFLLHEPSMLKKGPQGPRSRRLTAEEAERVKRLIEEGMSPAFARAQVLGEGGVA